MNQAEAEFQQLVNYARWSYLGILIPPVGIVLSIIVDKRLRALEPSTDKEVANIKHVARLAHWGAIASLWYAWFFIGAIITGLIIGVIGN